MKMLRHDMPTLNTSRVRSPQRPSYGRLGTKQRDLQRMRVWRSNPRCGACGGIVPYEGMELDHVVPLHLGGSTDDSNTQVMHTECHRAKTNAELSNRGRHVHIC